MVTRGKCLIIIGLMIKCTAAETNPDGTVKGEVIVRASWKHEEVDRNDLLAA